MLVRLALSVSSLAPALKIGRYITKENTFDLPTSCAKVKWLEMATSFESRARSIAARAIGTANTSKPKALRLSPAIGSIRMMGAYTWRLPSGLIL